MPRPPPPPPPPGATTMWSFLPRAPPLPPDPAHDDAPSPGLSSLDHVEQNGPRMRAQVLHAPKHQVGNAQGRKVSPSWPSAPGLAWDSPSGSYTGPPAPPAGAPVSLTGEAFPPVPAPPPAPQTRVCAHASCYWSLKGH